MSFFAIGLLITEPSRGSWSVVLSADGLTKSVPAVAGLIAIALHLYFSAQYLRRGPSAIAGRTGALIVVGLISLIPLIYTIPFGLIFIFDGVHAQNSLLAFYFSGIPILASLIMLIVLSVKAGKLAEDLKNCEGSDCA
ncbi:MAG: hypothetical protein AAF615_08050 [Pseudomonadota bacterium]